MAIANATERFDAFKAACEKALLFVCDPMELGGNTIWRVKVSLEAEMNGSRKRFFSEGVVVNSPADSPSLDAAKTRELIAAVWKDVAARAVDGTAKAVEVE